MSLPEIIYVEDPEVFDGMGFWQESEAANLTRYVKAKENLLTLMKSSLMISGFLSWLTAMLLLFQLITGFFSDALSVGFVLAPMITLPFMLIIDLLVWFFWKRWK